MTYQKSLKHKFNAKQTVRDNIKFSSKLEATFYDDLVLMQKAGVVYFFLRQVPFHLPGNIKYICDFQIFWADGHISFVDVKGFETKEFIMKKKVVESLYPIEIEIIKKGGAYVGGKKRGAKIKDRELAASCGGGKSLHLVSGE